MAKLTDLCCKLLAGSYHDASTVLFKDHQSVLKIVHASIDFTPSSPGKPISYSFRNLKDNSPVSLTLSSVDPVPTQLRVSSQSFVCNQADDGTSSDLEIDRMTVSASVRQTNAVPKKKDDFQVLYNYSDSN